MDLHEINEFASLIGEDKQKTRGHRKGLTLLHGCPRSKVYPVGHGVLVVTE